MLINSERGAGEYGMRNNISNKSVYFLKDTIACLLRRTENDLDPIRVFAQEEWINIRRLEQFQDEYISQEVVF